MAKVVTEGVDMEDLVDLEDLESVDLDWVIREED